MTSRIVTGAADAALDQRLSSELEAFNTAAMPGAAAVELTVQCLDDGELLGGVSGWTWREAAGIGLTWVREDHREIFRWDGVPVDGQADVHFRKEL